MRLRETRSGIRDAETVCMLSIHTVDYVEIYVGFASNRLVKYMTNKPLHILLFQTCKKNFNIVIEFILIPAVLENILEDSKNLS